MSAGTTGIRYDAALAELAPPRRLSDGTAVVSGVLARAGCMTYLNADGTRRVEYRPAEVLRKAVEAGLYNLRPTTLGHPGWLTADMIPRHQVGTSGQDVRMDGELVTATLAVYSGAAVDALFKQGVRHLSPAYRVKFRHEPGVAPDGQHYDVLQEEIFEVNHIAHIPRGRGGAVASVRMDSVDAIGIGDMIMDIETDITKLNVQVALLTADRDKAGQRADAAAAELTTVRRTLDTLQAQHDALVAERADGTTATEQQIASRVELLTSAARILPASIRMDASNTPDEIRRAVVKHISGVDIKPDASADYISARYDAAIEQFERSDKSKLKAVAPAKKLEIVSIADAFIAPKG